MQLLYKCKNTRLYTCSLWGRNKLQYCELFHFLYYLANKASRFIDLKKKIHYNVDLHSQKVNLPIFKWLFSQFNFNRCLRQCRLAFLIYKAATLIYFISFYKKKQEDFFFFKLRGFWLILMMCFELMTVLVKRYGLSLANESVTVTSFREADLRPESSQ